MFGDIRELSATTLKRRLGLGKGGLDLLAGCPPCQGFSRMTTRNGCWRIIDPRNGLIDEFKRLVVGLLPKTIMLENVPGLASERRFAGFCRALRKHGYVVDFEIVDAADHGVPQHRRRFVLLASRYGRVLFPNTRSSARSVSTVRAGMCSAGSGRSHNQAAASATSSRSDDCGRPQDA